MSNFECKMPYSYWVSLLNKIGQLILFSSRRFHTNLNIITSFNSYSHITSFNSYSHTHILTYIPNKSSHKILYPYISSEMNCGRYKISHIQLLLMWWVIVRNEHRCSATPLKNFFKRRYTSSNISLYIQCRNQQNLSKMYIIISSMVKSNSNKKLS